MKTIPPVMNNITRSFESIDYKKNFKKHRKQLSVNIP